MCVCMCVRCISFQRVRPFSGDSASPIDKAAPALSAKLVHAHTHAHTHTHTHTLYSILYIVHVHVHVVCLCAVVGVSLSFGRRRCS